MYAEEQEKPKCFLTISTTCPIGEVGLSQFITLRLQSAYKAERRRIFQNHQYLLDIHGKKKKRTWWKPYPSAPCESTLLNPNIGLRTNRIMHSLYFSHRRFGHDISFGDKYMDPEDWQPAKLSTEDLCDLAQTWNKLQPIPGVLPSNISGGIYERTSGADLRRCNLRRNRGTRGDFM